MIKFILKLDFLIKTRVKYIQRWNISNVQKNTLYGENLSNIPYV